MPFQKFVIQTSNIFCMPYLNFVLMFKIMQKSSLLFRKDWLIEGLLFYAHSRQFHWNGNVLWNKIVNNNNNNNNDDDAISDDNDNNKTNLIEKHRSTRTKLFPRH